MNKISNCLNFLGIVSGLLFGFFLILTVNAKQMPETNFDVTDYTVQIEPDIAAKTVKGEVSVKFTAFTANLTKIQLAAGNLEIDMVRENNRALQFEKNANLLLITLAKPAKLNETRTIEIAYHGTPRYGIKFYPEKNQVYTEFSTSQWMPCVDAPADRATFHLRLILPQKLKVVANGRFLRQTALANNKISSEWEQINPIPTYIFGFAAGEFREVMQNHPGIKLRYLAAPEFSAADLQKIFRETADILDFYENKAGVKYADQVYTQVLTAGNAEQEMSSFTALNEKYGCGVLKDEKDIWLGAHEFAHQWWGNMVTNRDWNHFWLNEGITNFMTAAYLEHRFGRSAYLAQIEDYRQSYEKVRAAGKDKPLVFPDWNKPTREDRTLVYDKGGYVMHLLREELGEKLFWKAFKEYTQTYFGKSVTTTDFQKAMEKSSGKNLSAFFNKWVYLR